MFCGRGKNVGGKNKPIRGPLTERNQNQIVKDNVSDDMSSVLSMWWDPNHTDIYDDTPKMLTSTPYHGHHRNNLALSKIPEEGMGSMCKGTTLSAGDMYRNHDMTLGTTLQEGNMHAVSVRCI